MEAKPKWKFESDVLDLMKLRSEDAATRDICKREIRSVRQFLELLLAASEFRKAKRGG